MALKLHNLKPAKGAKRKKKRVGRGDSSGHGTYSTRGLKGQRSRSGGKGGLKLKGLKSNMQSIPKLGGFKSFKPKMAVVNLKDLEKHFKDNDLITNSKLLEKGLISTAKNGVKLLGSGKVSKSFTVKIDKISESAKNALAKAKGKVILLSKEQKKVKNNSSEIKSAKKK